MTNCVKCNNPISVNYCSNCGQAAKLKRIDKHYMSHEAMHLLHYEKGFVYSAKELLLRPGIRIKEFIDENRNKLMKPVAYLILTSLLYTLVANFFHVSDFYNDKAKISLGKSSVTAIMNWVNTNYGYANLLSGIFIAWFVKLFFRKTAYNFFEIMILLCFVMGQAMLLMTLTTFFVGILGKQLYMVILFVLSFGYMVWAIGQFFDGTKIMSYVKALFAYLLGTLLFYLAIIPIGLTVDFIVKLFGTK